MSFLSSFTKWGDKTSTLGAIVSAMGCGMCFPAIASLGGALGLGFLSQWEWFLIETLMPIFAVIAILLNGLGWFNHHQWKRTVLGMIGPIALLLSLYPLFQYAWSTYVTYGALIFMVLVSIWDIVSPANKHCDDACELVEEK